jgi:hypothetical protein
LLLGGSLALVVLAPCSGAQPEGTAPVQALAPGSHNSLCATPAVIAATW